MIINIRPLGTNDNAYSTLRKKCSLTFDVPSLISFPWATFLLNEFICLGISFLHNLVECYKNVFTSLYVNLKGIVYSNGYVYSGVQVMTRGLINGKAGKARQVRQGSCLTYIFRYINPRTTDAQRGNSLHCTVENSIPNFQVWRQHILSATSAQIFRFL